MKERSLLDAAAMSAVKSDSQDRLGDYASEKLAALCEVTGFGADTARVVSIFRTLSASWGDCSRSRAPRWSGFSDDCSPYELSIALGGKRPEVRVGFEVQAASPSPETYWRASCDMNRWLGETYGADLEGFRRVEDLFRPTDPNAYFAMWHGACFWPGLEPAFKVYLNPYAQGRTRAPAALDEALGRLGYPRAISSLAERLRADFDQFLGLGLDMTKSLGGRAKVYLRLRRATREHVDALTSFAIDSRLGPAGAFAATLTGAPQLFDRRPLQICYSYLNPDGEGRRPDRVTLLVPPITYAPNDAVIRERVRAALADHDFRSEAYDRCVEAFAPGPAERERGAHGYVSFQWDGGRPRITPYFYARAFRDRFGEVDPVRPWPSPHRDFEPS